MLDEHSEGRAPVTDVVFPDDPVAGEGQHPAQGVPDDRGAQMTGMHLLGHVRGRVVHHHGGRVGDELGPGPGVGGVLLK